MISLALLWVVCSCLALTFLLDFIFQPPSRQRRSLFSPTHRQKQTLYQAVSELGDSFSELGRQMRIAALGKTEQDVRRMERKAHEALREVDEGLATCTAPAWIAEAEKDTKKSPRRPTPPRSKDPKLTTERVRVSDITASRPEFRCERLVDDVEKEIEEVRSVDGSVHYYSILRPRRSDD